MKTAIALQNYEYYGRNTNMEFDLNKRMATSPFTRDFANKIDIHKFRDWPTDFNVKLRQRLVNFIVFILFTIISDLFIRNYLRKSNNYMTVLCSALFFALMNLIVLKNSSYSTLAAALGYLTLLIFRVLNQKEDIRKEQFWNGTLKHPNGTIEKMNGSFFLPN